MPTPTAQPRWMQWGPLGPAPTQLPGPASPSAPCLVWGQAAERMQGPEHHGAFLLLSGSFILMGWPRTWALEILLTLGAHPLRLTLLKDLKGSTQLAQSGPYARQPPHRFCTVASHTCPPPQAPDLH